MNWEAPAWPFLIPIVAIIGGFVLAGLNIYGQIRRREFEHRERLAMIEKGVAPPGATPTPGTGPGTSAGIPGIAFDEDFGHWCCGDRAARTRRGGFVVLAVGLGVGFMLWMMSHESDVAVGMGGFLVILGAALFASSFFESREHRRSSGTAPDGSRR